jgi:hypothetical protein
MSGAIAKVKDEVRKILLVAVFFSTGFCLTHISSRLLTQGSNIQLASITRVIFGGRIVAKVLLVVDLLPFIDAFPGKPLVHNIAWKSWLYVAGCVIFLYIEPFLKYLIKGSGVYASHSQAWHELMLPRTWAKVIGHADDGLRDFERTSPRDWTRPV